MSKYQRALIAFYCLSCISEISFLILWGTDVIAWPWYWVHTPLWLMLVVFVCLGTWFTIFPEQVAEADPFTAAGLSPARELEEGNPRILEIMAKRQVRNALDHFDEIVVIVRDGDLLHVAHGTNGETFLNELFYEIRLDLAKQQNITPLKFPPNGK